MPDRPPDIRLKRIFEAPSPDDGRRVLVERLWPRGVRKEAAALDEWLREIAPSRELRQWFGHDPGRWPAFRQHYREELEAKEGLLDRLRAYREEGALTLVFAARDTERNSAVVLKELLEEDTAGPA